MNEDIDGWQIEPDSPGFWWLRDEHGLTIAMVNFDQYNRVYFAGDAKEYDTIQVFGWWQKIVVPKCPPGESQAAWPPKSPSVSI